MPFNFSIKILSILMKNKMIFSIIEPFFAKMTPKEHLILRSDYFIPKNDLFNKFQILKHISRWKYLIIFYIILHLVRLHFKLLSLIIWIKIESLLDLIILIIWTILMLLLLNFKLIYLISIILILIIVKRRLLIIQNFNLLIYWILVSIRNFVKIIHHLFIWLSLNLLILRMNNRTNRINSSLINQIL